MDKPESTITIIDENEITQREQVLSKIIAAALLEQVQLHINKNKKSIETGES